MESFNETLQRVEAQEMIFRFRSKEDLYRYMTQHGNQIRVQHQGNIVGIFLPSMEGTKLAFLRAILCDQKKSFKINEINHMEISSYQEISVTNLNEDAMNDSEVAQYLPTREQLSNKLPERQFFFGIQGTVRAEYLKDIIDEAHKKDTLLNLKSRRGKVYLSAILGQRSQRSILIFLVRMFYQHFRKTWFWNIPNERKGKVNDIKEIMKYTQSIKETK